MAAGAVKTLSRGPRRGSVLPGFRGTFIYTMTYLSLVVLIPLGALVLQTTRLTWAQFWQTASSPQAVAAYRLSFGGALIAAAVNAVFGLLLAWVLARYKFPGRALLDALVDLPLALPTAVAGIALAAIYSKNGLLGARLDTWGINVAFAPLGVVVAMIFVGIPFVVRTVQPVLMEIDPQVEEAAAVLGASRLQTFARVLLPALMPSLITGFALAFARALGEYGSVVFISGNLPLQTEIVPFLIASKLDQFDYEGANALAVVMLVGSFALLLVTNALQSWSHGRGRHG